MDIESVVKESDIPAALIDFKVQHYKEIFKSHFLEVLEESPSLEEGEELIIIKDLGKLIGGCTIKKDTYYVRFRGFSILPENRGRGYAKKLMHELEKITTEHHLKLRNSGEKPTDINQMYLKSLVYLDSDMEKEENPELQFSIFLKKFAFSPYSYNKQELSKEEIAAIKVYERLYSGSSSKLKVFKKPVVDEGVELKTEIKQELLALNRRQWEIVMCGLNWKLGNYSKTGQVSYRYDLCPICIDVKSDETNSENCKRCYIYTTCMEPFREAGRFKEDFEISNAYFSSMKDFMMKHPPKK